MNLPFGAALLWQLREKREEKTREEKQTMIPNESQSPNYV